MFAPVHETTPRILRQLGAIERTCGFLDAVRLHGNVLRINPPLCLTRDDAAFLTDVLDESFAEA